MDPINSFRSDRGIDSDRFAIKLRETLLDRTRKAVLLARLDGSLEARDRYTRANARGLGRVRVFRNYEMHLSRVRSLDGRVMPLLRGHPPTTELRSQVFQLAGCNWRCWYCYVDDSLLNARISRGEYLTASDLVDLYLGVPDRPAVIDLSGGQPDLVPEWTLWVLEEIDRRGLRGKVLIWQDDNLSSELMWDVLSAEQISFMSGFEGHSRVGCFKGFDSVSFSYNTSAPAELFERQFVVFRKLVDWGFDVFAYATFTCPSGHCSMDQIRRFVDRLQDIHPLLPLRTIPLKIRPFTATQARMRAGQELSFEEQQRAGDFWDAELRSRYSRQQLELPYEAVGMRRGHSPPAPESPS